MSNKHNHHYQNGNVIEVKITNNGSGQHQTQNNIAPNISRPSNREPNAPYVQVQNNMVFAPNYPPPPYQPILDLFNWNGPFNMPKNFQNEWTGNNYNFQNCQWQNTFHPAPYYEQQNKIREDFSFVNEYQTYYEGNGQQYEQMVPYVNVDIRTPGYNNFVPPPPTMTNRTSNTLFSNVSCEQRNINHKETYPYKKNDAKELSDESKCTSSNKKIFQKESVQKNEQKVPIVSIDLTKPNYNKCTVPPTVNTNIQNNTEFDNANKEAADIKHNKKYSLQALAHTKFESNIYDDLIEYSPHDEDTFQKEGKKYVKIETKDNIKTPSAKTVLHPLHTIIKLKDQKLLLSKNTLDSLNVKEDENKVHQPVETDKLPSKISYNKTDCTQLNKLQIVKGISNKGSSESEEPGKVFNKSLPTIDLANQNFLLGNTVEELNSNNRGVCSVTKVVNESDPDKISSKNSSKYLNNKEVKDTTSKTELSFKYLDISSQKNTKYMSSSVSKKDDKHSLFTNKHISRSEKYIRNSSTTDKIKRLTKQLLRVKKEIIEERNLKLSNKLTRSNRKKAKLLKKYTTTSKIKDLSKQLQMVEKEIMKRKEALKVNQNMINELQTHNIIKQDPKSTDSLDTNQTQSDQSHNQHEIENTKLSCTESILNTENPKSADDKYRIRKRLKSVVCVSKPLKSCSYDLGTPKSRYYEENNFKYNKKEIVSYKNQDKRRDKIIVKFQNNGIDNNSKDCETVITSLSKKRKNMLESETVENIKQPKLANKIELVINVRTQNSSDVNSESHKLSLKSKNFGFDLDKISEVPCDRNHKFENKFNSVEYVDELTDLSFLDDINVDEIAKCFTDMETTSNCYEGISADETNIDIQIINPSQTALYKDTDFDLLNMEEQHLDYEEYEHLVTVPIKDSDIEQNIEEQANPCENDIQNKYDKVTENIQDKSLYDLLTGDSQNDENQIKSSVNEDEDPYEKVETELEKMFQDCVAQEKINEIKSKRDQQYTINTLDDIEIESALQSNVTKIRKGDNIINDQQFNMDTQNEANDFNNVLSTTPQLNKDVKNSEKQVSDHVTNNNINECDSDTETRPNSEKIDVALVSTQIINQTVNKLCDDSKMFKEKVGKYKNSDHNPDIQKNNNAPLASNIKLSKNGSNIKLTKISSTKIRKVSKSKIEIKLNSDKEKAKIGTKTNKLKYIFNSPKSMNLKRDKKKQTSKNWDVIDKTASPTCSGKHKRFITSKDKSKPKKFIKGSNSFKTEVKNNLAQIKKSITKDPTNIPKSNNVVVLNPSDKQTNNASNETKDDKLTSKTHIIVEENYKSPNIDKRLIQLSEPEKSLALYLAKTLTSKMKIPYIVNYLIRKGKFSTIFHCTDKNGKYTVAKVSRDTHTTLGHITEEMIKKLQSDIPINNLAFVQMLNAIIVGNSWCFILDYMPYNLEQSLETINKPFDIDHVLILARQLISAVFVLRTHNMVHTDIKPRHILLNAEYNQLKLCGFDELSYVENLKFTPNIGTTSYRAPEVILGHSVNFSMDVWSSALVLHEMLTHDNLLCGDSNNEVLYQQMCTFGNVSEIMLQKCQFRNVHFCGTKFLRQVPREIITEFPGSARLSTSVFEAYFRYWHKSRKSKKTQDVINLRAFSNLLSEMLIIDPSQRLTIEFVYANPLIYK